MTKHALIALSSILLGFLLLLTISTIATARPRTVALLQNDNGQVGGTFDDLTGRRTLAVRLSLPPRNGPLRLDTLQIYMAPQPGSSTARLFIRLETVAGDVPDSGEPERTWRVTVPLTTAGWYSIPLYHLLISDGDSVIISIKSEDFPWAPPPLIMLDDSQNIEVNRNFYGQNFSSWQEHYQFWPNPESVGHLMMRLAITSGDAALLTPTATPAATVTATATATNTPTPTATPTSTPTPTGTATPTSTPTSTPDTGTVRGTVYADGNGNGEQDGDEPGIGDIEVTLSGMVQGRSFRPAFAGTTLTDDAGAYRFQQVPPGEYALSFALPIDYVSPLDRTLNVTVLANADTEVPYPALPATAWLYLPLMNGKR